MRVCILGNGLSSLTLAKSLVNQKIYVDVLYPKKKRINPEISANRLVAKSMNKLAVFLIFIYMNQLYHFVSSNFCC